MGDRNANVGSKRGSALAAESDGSIRPRGAHWSFARTFVASATVHAFSVFVRTFHEGDDVLRPDLDRPRQGRARAEEAARLPLDVLALEGEVVQLAPLPVRRGRIPVEFEHVFRAFAPQRGDFPAGRLNLVAAEVLHPDGVAIEGDRSVPVLDLDARVGVAHGEASVAPIDPLRLKVRLEASDSNTVKGPSPIPGEGAGGRR